MGSQNDCLNIAFERTRYKSNANRDVPARRLLLALDLTHDLAAGPMVNDPRGAVGNFIRRGIVAGYKAIKFLISSKYRTRVRQYWQIHPQLRASNIRMMIFGVALNCGILWLVVEAMMHRQ